MINTPWAMCAASTVPVPKSKNTGTNYADHFTQRGGLPLTEPYLKLMWLGGRPSGNMIGPALACYIYVAGWDFHSLTCI